MKPWQALACASLMFVAAGCGKAEPPDRCTVMGKVTYKGEPVPFGFITFILAANEMHQVAGQIKPDGTYVMTEAPLGECKVLLQVNNAFDEQAYQQMGKALPKGEVLPRELGKKYATKETTPVRRTTKAGENVIDIEIE